MLYLVIKAALSGILIAIISEVAKRYPGFGGLIAALPFQCSPVPRTGCALHSACWAILRRRAPGAAYSDALAVARQAGRGEHGGPCRGDFLVRAAVAAPPVLARPPDELRASLLLIPAMLRNGFLPVLAMPPAWLRASVWVALAAGCALTIALYGLMVWAGPRLGLRM